MFFPTNRDKIREVIKINNITILDEKISILLVKLLTKNFLIISLVTIALEVKIKLAIDCTAAIAQIPKIPKKIKEYSPTRLIMEQET